MHLLSEKKHTNRGRTATLREDCIFIILWRFKRVIFQRFNHSSSILPLIIGFSIFVSLFFTSWVITTNQLKEYEELNTATEIAGEKMEAVNALIRIARARTRLSHDMLVSEDIFEKDEIAMKITLLAGDFILNRRKLVALDLTAHEKAILDAQQPLYPPLIDNLNFVAELALEDTDEANDRARRILLRKVMPVQDEIIDGFGAIMQSLDDKVHAESLAASVNNQKNRRIRLWLLFFILLVSFTTIVIVIRNILCIHTIN